MDKMEEYVRKNREELDKLSPSPGIWKERASARSFSFWRDPARRRVFSFAARYGHLPQTEAA